MPRINGRFGPDPIAVAARIRAERERLGLTQEQAAEWLGIGRGSYRQLEESANPQLSTLVALAELGMRPGELIPEIFPKKR